MSELFNYDTWDNSTIIYFGIATFATTILVFQIFLTLVGFGLSSSVDADIDMDVDSDIDADHDLSGAEGMAFFSIRAIIAFLCLFGWMGFLCLRNSFGGFIALFAALLAGSSAFIAVAYLLHFMMKMASSGTVQTKEAVGSVGTVYIAIPEGKNIMGAVNVSLNDATRECRAVSEDGKGIATGAKVKITGMLDPRTLIVRTLEVSSDWMEKGI